MLIIPLRMLVAPLFLISAWFNFSPWQIVSADWYFVVKDHKSQWITVYSCFGGLAFAGLLTGVVFFVRAYTDLSRCRLNFDSDRHRIQRGDHAGVRCDRRLAYRSGD